MSLMTYPHVVSSTYDCHSSPEHSLRYFRLVQEFSVPPLKMYVQYTVLVQKGNKEITKVVHVTPVG